MSDPHTVDYDAKKHDSNFHIELMEIVADSVWDTFRDDIEEFYGFD